MHSEFCKIGRVLTSLALAIAILGPPAFAGRIVTVPVGTIIPLRMRTHLSSATARVGDPFTATVFRAIELDRRSGVVMSEAERRRVIPVGSRVEGRVTAVEDARSMGRGGTLAITFDRLILPDGRAFPIRGTLTSLDEKARARLEEEFGREERIAGESHTREAIVFIGAGAGIGAAIGAITEGREGAVVGAGVGAVLGTLAAVLNKGEEAVVRPGTDFAMKVERVIRIDIDMNAAEVLGERVTSEDDYQERDRDGQDRRDRYPDDEDHYRTRAGRYEAGYGDALRIAALAQRLLLDYRRDLNIRGSQERPVFDARRGLRQGEVELLFHLQSLEEAASLYHQMVGAVSDPEAIRGAADALLNQARLVNRVLRRGRALAVSSAVRTDWQELRQEIARIRVTDADLDADIDRRW